MSSSPVLRFFRTTIKITRQVWPRVKGTLCYFQNLPSLNFTVESSYLYPLGSILLTAGVKTSAALKNARVRHGTYDSEKT